MKHIQRSTLGGALALCLFAAPAFAQSVGSFTLEGGFTRLSPAVKSGDLSAPAFPNTKTDVTSATGLTGAVSYIVSDQIAVSVPLGLGFKHDLVGDGSASAFGKLGSVKALPVTVLGQYRFGETSDAFRPYIGAGLTYAKFYKATGSAALTALTNPGGKATTFKVDSKLVPTIQFGAIYNIDEKWFVNAHYTKTFLKTTTTFSTNQTISTTLNPAGLSFAIGYKF
jgi:outer membrane protein